MARIIGGIGDAIGTTATGDDRITLRWDGSGQVQPGGTRVDWVTLDFGDAPAGTYTITVVVTDRTTGQSVERATTLVRSNHEAER